MLCSTSLISLILLSVPSSLPVRYLILPGRATASIGAATGTCARTTCGQRLTSLLAGFCLPSFPYGTAPHRSYRLHDTIEWS
jgi:hypothetical protein